MSIIKLDIPKKSEPARKRLPKKLTVVKRKKPDSLKRSRVLKRKNVRFDVFAQMIDGEVHINYDHIPYFWAAYKRGALPDLESEMDSQQFTGWLVNRITSGVIAGGEAITLIGKTVKHGEIPLCLFVIEYHGMIAYPDAMWSPDASPRTILEGDMAFLIQLKKKYLALVKVEKKNELFFNHLSKYGVVRKIGKVRDWFGTGRHVMLYQTVGN